MLGRQAPKESNTASIRNELSAPPCGSLVLFSPCVGQKGKNEARQIQKEDLCFLLDFGLPCFIWLILKTCPSALVTGKKSKQIFRKDRRFCGTWGDNEYVHNAKAVGWVLEWAILLGVGLHDLCESFPTQNILVFCNILVCSQHSAQSSSCLHLFKLFPQGTAVWWKAYRNILKFNHGSVIAFTSFLILVISDSDN